MKISLQICTTVIILFVAILAWAQNNVVYVGLSESGIEFKDELIAAKQGEVTAQYNVGICYLMGVGVEKDDREGAKWLRKAADQGFAYAQSNLGILYDNGVGVAEDDAEAVKWYRKAAEQGDAYAQFNLAMMYYNGKGVTKDYDEAVKWYRKAAEQGDASAQRNLGIMYANGAGVVEDDAEAVKWYRKAAEQGDAYAQFNLAMMYYNGKGVTKDYDEAVKWYRKAAEQGDASAQNNLGIMYANGEGVEKDEREAVKWYRKAAEQGHATAQFLLGMCYSYGEGVEKDLVEAAKWLRIGAERGDAKSQWALGNVIFKQNGAYTKEVVAWYLKSMDQHFEKAAMDFFLFFISWQSKPELAEFIMDPAKEGSPNAQYYLGLIYAKGYAVKKDEAEAVKWYRKAAEQGDSAAQFNLGEMYRDGKGVLKNYSEAIKWFLVAARLENKKATKELGKLIAEGKYEHKNVKESAAWVCAAAKSGHIKAQLVLGLMYLRGDGFEKNRDEAIKWIRSAAEQGNVMAHYYLAVIFSTDGSINQAEAVKWCRKPAEEGYALAQILMGDLCKKCGEKGDVIEWYRKAAEKEVVAQYKLGECYEKGEGVEKNEIEAFKWYHKAAEGGYANAQCRIAQMLEIGQGCDLDEERAYQWYYKAAQSDNAEAQYYLGCVYQYGNGAPMEFEKAKYWFEKAAANEYAIAKKKLKLMREIEATSNKDKPFHEGLWLLGMNPDEVFRGSEVIRVTHRYGLSGSSFDETRPTTVYLGKGIFDIGTLSLKGSVRFVGVSKEKTILKGRIVLEDSGQLVGIENLTLKNSQSVSTVYVEKNNCFYAKDSRIKNRGVFLGENGKLLIFNCEIDSCEESDGYMPAICTSGYCKLYLSNSAIGSMSIGGNGLTVVKGCEVNAYQKFSVVSVGQNSRFYIEDSKISGKTSFFRKNVGGVSISSGIGYFKNVRFEDTREYDIQNLGAKIYTFGNIYSMKNFCPAYGEKRDAKLPKEKANEYFSYGEIFFK